jgi:tape measure domain-containing protein
VDAGSVELELILTGLSQVKKDLDKFERNAKKSADEAEKGWKKLQKTVDGFGRSVVGIAAALGAGAFFKAAITEALDFDRAVTKLNATLGKDGTQVIISQLRRASEEYGVSLKSLTDNFGSFTAAATRANIPIAQQLGLFEQITKSSVALGLGNNDLKLIFNALSQTASKGVVSMEELRQQLGERLPTALAALSLGLGKTQKEVIDLVSSGSLSAQDFVPALTTGLAQLGSDIDLSGAASDFRTFQAQLEEFMRQLGDVLLPGVIDALNILTKTMSNANLGNLAEEVYDIPINTFGGDANKEFVKGLEDIRIEAGLTEKEMKKLWNAALNKANGSTTSSLFGTSSAIGNEERSMKALLEVIKEYRKEKENPIKKKDARIIEANRLLRLEEDRVKALAASNEEAKRAEALALQQAKVLYGPQTQAIIASQIKLAQAQREAAMFKDTTTTEAQDAASAQLVAAEEAAQTIKEAYKEARNTAIEAADALGEARSTRAKQLFDKDSGINQFLSGGALGARRKEGIQLQKNEAGRLKRELVKSFAEAGNFMAARQIGAKRFGSFDERQKFIDAARDELYGQKALITANEKLQKALTDLNTTIIKGFDGGSTAQKEDYRALKDSIDSLVQKDWSVGVEARLEADGSISVQNALS